MLNKANHVFFIFLMLAIFNVQAMEEKKRVPHAADLALSVVSSGFLSDSFCSKVLGYQIRLHELVAESSISDEEKKDIVQWLHLLIVRDRRYTKMMHEDEERKQRQQFLQNCYIQQLVGNQERKKQFSAYTINIQSSQQSPAASQQRRP